MCVVMVSPQVMGGIVSITIVLLTIAVMMAFLATRDARDSSAAVSSILAERVH